MTQEHRCPDCGRGFETQHGVNVHRGMIHPDEHEEGTVRLTPQELQELTELATTSKLLQDVLERVTGYTLDREVPKDPEDARRELTEQATVLRAEVDRRLPPGYHPEPGRDIEKTYR